jgi:hypothetical protein
MAGCYSPCCQWLGHFISKGAQVCTQEAWDEWQSLPSDMCVCLTGFKLPSTPPALPRPPLVLPHRSEGPGEHEKAENS